MATLSFDFGFASNASPAVILTSTELTGAAAPTVNISKKAFADGTITSVVSGGTPSWDSYTKTFGYILTDATPTTHRYVAAATTTYATASPASVHALGIVIPDELVSTRLAPTTAGRTLDVASTGEAGIDLTNKLDTAGILPSAAAGGALGLPLITAAGNLPADVNTIKTKSVTVDAGGTTFPAVVGSGTSTYAGGAVASVTGDVAGKVLGGGASTITGVGVWADLRSILGTLLTETTPGWLSVAFKKLFNVATPLLVASDVMRGTDGAYTGANQDIRDAMKLAPSGGAPAVGSIDKHLDDMPTDVDTALTTNHGAGAWGASMGTSSKVYTVTSGGVPVSDVYCRMTTDVAGLNNIDAGLTDGLGQVTFHHSLPAGTTVYIWRFKSGYVPSDPEPDVEVI